MRNVRYLPSPVLSILLAVLTVSPNKQYLGILIPTTPATHLPVNIIEKCMYLVCFLKVKLFAEIMT